jgi:hypothetical protein
MTLSLLFANTNWLVFARFERKIKGSSNIRCGILIILQEGQWRSWTRKIKQSSCAASFRQIQKQNGKVKMMI